MTQLADQVWSGECASSDSDSSMRCGSASVCQREMCTSAWHIVRQSFRRRIRSLKPGRDGGGKAGKQGAVCACCRRALAVRWTHSAGAFCDLGMCCGPMAPAQHLRAPPRATAALQAVRTAGCGSQLTSRRPRQATSGPTWQPRESLCAHLIARNGGGGMICPCSQHRRCRVKLFHRPISCSRGAWTPAAWDRAFHNCRNTNAAAAKFMYSSSRCMHGSIQRAAHDGAIRHIAPLPACRLPSGSQLCIRTFKLRSRMNSLLTSDAASAYACSVLRAPCSRLHPEWARCLC